MIKKLLFIMVCTIMLGLLSADTIPGGNVSGIWYAANSPYYIAGNITIQNGNTLTIEPAVDIEFQGDYSLTVNGFLEAVGSDTDSISFFPVNINVGWAGIRFINAADSSHLVYCTVRNAGDSAGFEGEGGIYCSNSNPVISYCNIHDNTTGDDVHGGGIGLVNSSGPEIAHCTITGNLGSYGGGIHIDNSTVTITDCFFSDNASIFGGGIYLSNSQVTLDSCDINNSWGVSWGGGIYGENSTLILLDCIISDNSVNRDGGGICLDNTDATLTDCSIYNNSCPNSGYVGGGIGCINSGSTVDLSYCAFWDNYSYDYGGAVGLETGFNNSLTVDHCTFYRNDVYSWGDAIYIGSSGQGTIHNSIFNRNRVSGVHYAIWNAGALTSLTYTCFHDNINDIAYPPAGFGILDTINYNGDSCDIYFNLFVDPMFEDTASRDFHLTENSPCIDAGDPSYPLDPDSTICDMGAYWFDQTGVVEYPVVKHANNCDFLGSTVFSGPLQLPEGVQYKVLDITGRVIAPGKIKPGIYFIEIDGHITQKVIKVR